MKEILIISGKGGTGKTTLTASVAKYMSKKVICDADVDAADMFLLMKPEIKKKMAFKGKSVAIINNELCTSCDLCRKRQAHMLAEEENAEFVIVDGPPGIGCPVTSALSGANIAIIVTEPTFSGIHDLERVYETAIHFKTTVWIVINKYDLNLKNSEKIEKFAREKGIDVVKKIPFSKCIIDSVVRGEIPADNCPELRVVVENLINNF